MKFLSKNIIINKTVILRCDFNVPVKDNKVVDNSKIIRSLKTINYLLNNGNKVLILSHFGRVKKEEDKDNNSLYPVYEELKKYVNVNFINENESISDILNNSGNMCYLLENTRFTDLPEKKESVNDLKLAKYWASFADVFVIDAFASMHRVHSSTAGISLYLPTYIGFLLEQELNNLDILIKKQKQPFVVIMGGAKIDDKIKIIEGMVAKCDKLIITGGILNSFLKVMGKNIGKSICSEDETILKNVENIVNKYKEKIVYSERFIVENSKGIREINIDEIQTDDIIYDNIVNNVAEINSANVIFFNGTCGKFEDLKFSKGTQMLLNTLKNSNALVIIGGGDTVSAVNSFGYGNDFYYLSSGGGATLEYVAYGELKALKWIIDNGFDE